MLTCPLGACLGLEANWTTGGPDSIIVNFFNVSKKLFHSFRGPSQVLSQNLGASISVSAHDLNLMEYRSCENGDVQRVLALVNFLRFAFGRSECLLYFLHITY